jgi:hypothetical protein
VRGSPSTISLVLTLMYHLIVFLIRRSKGTRGTKADPATGKHRLFSFLTTDVSADVAPIHPDATPVLLLGENAREMWMGDETAFKSVGLLPVE